MILTRERLFDLLGRLEPHRSCSRAREDCGCNVASYRKLQDGLDLVLKVVEAAKKMDAQFGGAWLEDFEGNKFQVRDHTGMREALAPFEEEKL